MAKVVEIGVFEKNYKCTPEVDDGSSDSEDENDPKECFYTPNDSKAASDSLSLKSCIPGVNEGMYK